MPSASSFIFAIFLPLPQRQSYPNTMYNPKHRPALSVTPKLPTTRTTSSNNVFEGIDDPTTSKLPEIRQHYWIPKDFRANG
ncbi:hypothetical protein BJ165DRAFT_1535477 [Panaeolus papilionaceus]|nr:hypothetical protein BJ165DRAFT_1535477 [Panaeolus papilionaceus]